MAEESIYNLVPHIPEPVARGARYRSKHDPRAAPTYSTFPRKENGAGAGDGSGALLFAGQSGAIGRDVGPDVDPKRFLKAHSAKRDKLPHVETFERPLVAPTKSSVPRRDDKPVMGLMTEKDFVHANAVEAACASAVHRGPKEQPRASQRADFGKTPAYLNRIKSEIDYEKSALAERQTMEADYQASVKANYVREVDDSEKDGLVAALRQRWEEKHRQYHALPFAQDTAMQIARKEAIERELKEIETALQKLSKKVVVVYNDKQGPQVSNWAKSMAQTDAQRTATRMVNDSIYQKSSK